MENDREEIVDIRSCIAYLMVKWKVLLIALLLGVLAGGVLGILKQRAQDAKELQEEEEIEPVSDILEPATYEEKLQMLRDTLQESEALYVEQVYAQYRNYGKQLGYWRQYLANSALQNMKPDNYVKRDLQFVVESNNSDVISSFSVSLLGTADYERIAEAMGDTITAANAVELISVSNVTQADSETNQPAAVQIGDVVTQDPSSVSVTPNSYRSIMDITFIASDEEKADTMEEIIGEILEDRKAELKKSGVEVDVESLNRTTVANDYTWLLGQQQSKLGPMQSLQTARSNFVRNTVDTLREDEKAYFEGLRAEQAGMQEEEMPEEPVETEADKANKINKIKIAIAGGFGLLVLAAAVVLLIYVYSDRIRAEEQLKRGYGLPVLLRYRIGKGSLGKDPLRNRGLGILTGVEAAVEAGSGAGRLAAELTHRIASDADKSVFLAYDIDSEEVRDAVAKLAESLREKGLTAGTGMPVSGDEDYQSLLAADAAVVVETMNESRVLALKDLLGICRRNSVPVLGCVTLTDVGKY